MSAIVCSRKGILHLILRKSAADSFSRELQTEDYRPGALGGAARGFGRSNRKRKSPSSGLFMRAEQLRCARFRVRIDADLEPCLVLVLELHDAVDEGVDREIGAET